MTRLIAAQRPQLPPVAQHDGQAELTYRRLEKEAMRRGRVLPHSTIATALKRESLPRTELVEALVSACGCDEETVARGPVVRTDEAFTITAWVRLDETGDWGTVFSEHHGGHAPDVTLLDYDAEHRDWAFMLPERRKGWAMGDETVFGGVRPERGRWTHLAAVHDPAGRRVRLYVDGALEACRTRTFLTRAHGPLDIGRAVQDGEPVDGWRGAVDDVRVFARALTRAQVGGVMAHRA